MHVKVCVALSVCPANPLANLLNQSPNESEKEIAVLVILACCLLVVGFWNRQKLCFDSFFKVGNFGSVWHI
jgi:uncharacterized membrane protein YwzB